MGAWGYHADANDESYDELALGTDERLHGTDAAPPGERDAAARELEQRNGKALSAGAVVLMAKMGHALDAERCERAIAELRMLKTNGDDLAMHVNQAERAQALQEDINLLNAAIAAGGAAASAPAPVSIAEAIMARGGGGYTGLTKQRDAPAGIPPFMLYNVGQKRHPTDTVNKREGGYVPPRATANAR